MYCGLGTASLIRSKTCCCLLNDIQLYLPYERERYPMIQFCEKRFKQGNYKIVVL